MGAQPRQVIMSGEKPAQVKFAYWTARSLHSELAGITEALMDKGILETVKGHYYPLAVAHEGLPETRGFYQVDRTTATLKSITDGEAIKLITEGRWDEVLHVSERALAAAKECRPLALDVGSNEHGWCLYAIDWPDSLAHTVLVKPKQSETRTALQGRAGELLRDPEIEAVISKIYEYPPHTALTSEDLEALRGFVRGVRALETG